MKRLLILLLMLAMPVCGFAAQGFEVQSCYFDGQGRFTVEVDVPEGTRHAVLEGFVPGQPVAWRNLVSGAVDGRAARVVFRLPAAFSTREMVRARIGSETTVPAAQLNDPSLYTVIYGGLDEQLKLDFLKNASAKMREWAALPQAQYQANLIAWAQGNPLVTKAVVSMPADNVSIRFTDGDVCVLLNKQRDSEGLTTVDMPSDAYRKMSPLALKRAEAAKGGESDPSTTASFAESLGLPFSKRVVVANSLESFFPDSAPTIGNWLTASGYDVRRFSGTTVADVKGWFSTGSLGVLFWHVHGCSFEKEDGTQSVGLVTRQFATVELSKGDYKAMRDSGEVGLAIDRGQTVPFYTITSDFVRNHMSFAPNSLVVVDACHGTDADLAQAFIDAGAGSYASWDWVSGKLSGDSCRKVFDRMLGMNQEPPVSAVRERSFSQPIVETWMWQQGYEIDPSPKYSGQARDNARLVWKHHPQAPAYVLKPTIIRILNQIAGPTQRFSALMIEGSFGDDPGAGQRNVVWGGQVQTILRWEGSERIYIRVPNPVPVGNVQVIVTPGFAYTALSNEVPITEWTVPFTWSYHEAGTLTEKMVMNVKFRADLRGERVYPESPVIYNPTSFYCMPDCTGTMTASGTYSPMQGVTLSYNGGSTMQSYDLLSDQMPPVYRLTNSGTMKGDGTFSAFSLKANGAYNQTYTYTLPDGSSMSQPAPGASNFDGSAFFSPMPSFHPGTFVLQPGSKPVPHGSGTATLSWPATAAVAAPTGDTPR
jgi:hypothetical protein